MNKESGFTWKLGMFVVIGLVLFTAAIYLVGKQKNLFGSTITLKAQFKSVSGLKVGNNVRFSGINVGTVDGIELTTDTTVTVYLLIKKDVQKFIKTDAVASIASDGLMGDKVLTISPGTPGSATIGDNALIGSKTAVEMSDVMASLKSSVDNAGVITGQLAEVSYKINNGNGALARLISDEGFSNSLRGTLTNLQTSTNQFSNFTTNLNKGALSEKLDSTMTNLQSSTKGLSENMEAAKQSILFRGYFKKQKKAEEKKKADLKKQEARNKQQALKNAKDSIKNQ